jgi:hypothetical protein
MKKSILTATFAVACILLFSSLTYNAAHGKSDNVGKVMFSVPIAPKSTIITKERDVYKYLKKGYQIQNAWYNSNTYENSFVVVKY